MTNYNERFMTNLFDEGLKYNLYTKVVLEKDVVVSSCELINNDRYKHVMSKLKYDGVMTNELSMDLFLGIDYMVELDGRIVGIDFTTCKPSGVKNKIQKAESLELLYEYLGIDQFVVVRCDSGFAEIDILDVLCRMERNTFKRSVLRISDTTYLSTKIVKNI